MYVFCPTSTLPENLDFFLPNQSKWTNPLSDFLHLHDYCLLLQTPSQESATYGNIIQRVERYFHRVSKGMVRLVYAKGCFPLGPLLDSQSTLLMHYISFDQAVCLYPLTTLMKIGVRLQSHDNAMKAFAKYRRIERGESWFFHVCR